MNIAHEIKKTRYRIIQSHEKFQHGCEICSVSRRKGMTFHHHWYESGDAVYRDFAQTVKGRFEYYQKLEHKVKENPSRFAYLCAKHHYSLERALHYSDNVWDKLTELRKIGRENR